MEENVIELKCNSGLWLILKYVAKVFPEVKKHLKSLKNLSGKVSDRELRKQILASIEAKSFHCLGGCAYALYPDIDFDSAVKFVVSLQTISDYLDNLCDRTEVKDKQAFRQLHISMLDATEPSRALHDYYKFYPHKKDNDYLSHLVNECRKSALIPPSYSLAIHYIKRYIMLYSSLQTYKHLDDNVRENFLKEWANKYIINYSDISIWEFSASAGSTLGIFAMYVAAYDEKLTKEEAELIDKAYFPWICGLHILMDYYIDSVEDMDTGDLNFTYYYRNINECEERILFFVQKSLQMCEKLRYPLFHKTIVKGILAMYLSDSKALHEHNKKTSIRIIKNCGTDTKLYHGLCRLLRHTGIL
jgi:tetraprenyl-beta-curcumene synthase